MLRLPCNTTAVKWARIAMYVTIAFIRGNKRMLFQMVFIYLATFCFLMPISTRGIKYTAFYQNYNDENEAIAQERLRNDRRVSVCNDYLDKYARVTRRARTARFSDKVDVLISVVSLRRSKIDGYDPRYLTQTVTKLSQILDAFQNDTRLNDYYGMVLCNVDPQPEKYEELKSLSRSLNVPSVERFPAGDKVPKNISTSTCVKEINDYRFCLKESLARNPNYLLVLEDDAILVDDALHTVRHILSYALPLHRHAQNSDLGPTGFLQLYLPYRFLLRLELREAVGISFFIGTMVFLIHSTILRIRRSYSRVCVLWFLWITYFFILCVLIGHANLLKMRGISKYLYEINRFRGCCMPVVLFPQKGAQLLFEFYGRKTVGKCVSKDLILGEYLNETRQEGYSVMPNIADHIGMYSAVKGQIKDPYIVDIYR